MKKIILLLSFIPSFVMAQTYDVLFLGNSYTFSNSLPLLIQEIALSFGDTVNYDTYTPGGYTLEDHATNPITLEKINSNNWDFVVIQAQSQEPSFPPFQVEENTYPYAAELVSQIAANDSCTEPVFFMTWGRKNGDQQNAQFYPVIGTYLGMQWRLRESYLEMGYENDATIAPVGMAWKESILTNPDFELYSQDGSHPSMEGSYLAACTFYSTFFQESSIGSNYLPDAMSLEDAQYLQEIATETVLDSVGVWNMFAIQEINANGEVEYNFTSELSNVDAFYWDFGDGTTSDEQNPNHTYIELGQSYTITLTAYSNGYCLSTSDTLEIYVDAPNLVEDFPVAQVYPNPTIDHIDIALNSSTEWQLLNHLGEVLQKDKGQGKTTINLGDYYSGIYYLYLTTKTHTQQIKIVKQ